MNRQRSHEQQVEGYRPRPRFTRGLMGFVTQLPPRVNHGVQELSAE